MLELPKGPITAAARFVVGYTQHPIVGHVRPQIHSTVVEIRWTTKDRNALLRDRSAGLHAE